MVSMDGEDDVLATCYRTDKVATEDVLLNAIRRDLRNGSKHMLSAANLAYEYWSSSLASSVVEPIENGNTNEASRAELLRILAARSADHALPLVRRIIGRESDTPLWRAALDTLVQFDLDTAWPHIEAAFRRRGKDALLDLPSLYSRRSGVRIDSAAWTCERILSLARMLQETFPQEDDSEERGGWVTPEYELRALRRSIPHLLFRRGDDDNRQGLEQLVSEQPHLADWYEHAKAEEAAHGELARVAGPMPDERAYFSPPPYQKIVELLENAEYRIVRRPDDLLDVLEELLERIGKEAGNHIEMLYSDKNSDGGRKRLNESALQTYVECRLHDLLPGRILDDGTKVSFHRERQIRLRQRTDIEVVAPLVGNGLATVVIEVKWSDNCNTGRNISTALVTQLGEKYLAEDGKTHGIYLVGWNGKLGTWSRTAGPRPDEPITRESLKVAFSRQAREFCAKHEGIRISAVVLDIKWPLE